MQKLVRLIKDVAVIIAATPLWALMLLEHKRKGRV